VAEIQPWAIRIRFRLAGKGRAVGLQVGFENAVNSALALTPACTTTGSTGG
jgi:hypothetical protein